MVRLSSWSCLCLESFVILQLNLHYRNFFEFQMEGWNGMGMLEFLPSCLQKGTRRWKNKWWMILNSNIMSSIIFFLFYILQLEEEQE